jgi:rare lipoprotein A
LALTAANCAQPQKMSGRGGIDPKYGVAASPKVIPDGEPIPKGGGREMVGRPYTVAGRTYVPQENPAYAREGLASWYGVQFHGRLTANGEIFDRESVAAAHTTMPLPSYARVTNLQNGRSIIVRVNDRGPYHANRIMDVSEMTAEALDFRRAGTARVRVEYVGRASPAGSDDRILLASLRTDGQPATLTARGPTLMAQAAPRATELPRQAIAYRSPEPEAPARLDMPAAAPAIGGRMAAGVPLPPERPFDLGTIPNAATPVSSAGAVLPPARPVVAQLHYAPRSGAEGFRAQAAFTQIGADRFARIVQR